MRFPSRAYLVGKLLQLISDFVCEKTETAPFKF